MKQKELTKTFKMISIKKNFHHYDLYENVAAL